MTRYSFSGQWEAQKPYSEKFVAWLEGQEKVTSVREGSLKDDLKGIDFFVTTGNKTRTVQLKVDFKADKTGNLPVEALSQAYHYRNSVIGSVFAMEGVDLLFYLLIPSGRIKGYKTKNFLQFVIEHYGEFRNYVALNENHGVEYRTLGVLVPIHKLKHLAIVDSRLTD